MRKDFYSSYHELEDDHWWFVGRRRVFTRLLDGRLATADGGRPRRLLDVGCGTGRMLLELARYGEPVGVDADPEAIRLSRRRGPCEVRRAGGERLPFADARFDVVTALDVLEHADDDRAVLAELHRVLRPGGTLLVSVPAYRWMWGPQDEIARHRRRYRRPELGERLTVAGFEVLRLSYFNTLLFPPIAAIRLLRPRRSANGDSARSDFEVPGNRRLNGLLTAVFSLEAPLVERFDLPFGVSILGLSRRA